MTGRADVMDAAHAGGIGGTYSGNPVACEAALGVFETIESQGLLARARRIGEMLQAELTAIAADTNIIGDIRGRGAMIAAEFVTGADKAPNRDAVAEIVRYAQANGVLTLTAGTFGNVLRFLPPLTISDDLLLEGLGVIRDAVARI